MLGVHCGADLLPGNVDREEVAGGVLGPRAVRWGRVLVSMCCGEGTSVAGVGNRGGGTPSTQLGVLEPHLAAHVRWMCLEDGSLPPLPGLGDTEVWFLEHPLTPALP